MQNLMYMRVAIIVLLLSMGTLFSSENVCAQEMDFGRIDKFESMGTATLRGGSPPKTIVDDGEQHAVLITIWESNTDAKTYWKTLDCNTPQTTIIHGTGVHAFQTAGEFGLEAFGDPSHSIKFGYLLLGIGK